jgi:hypothetical protein
MRYLQEPNRHLPDTVSPADFPLGSRQSRAAARMWLASRNVVPGLVVVFVDPRKPEGCQCEKCLALSGAVHMAAKTLRAEPEIFFLFIDVEGHYALQPDRTLPPRTVPVECTPVVSGEQRSTTGENLAQRHRGNSCWR